MLFGYGFFFVIMLICELKDFLGVVVVSYFFCYRLCLLWIGFLLILKVLWIWFSIFWIIMFIDIGLKVKIGICCCS